MALGQAQTLAATRPEAAVDWRSGFAPALSRHAENLAVQAFRPAEYANAAAFARRALVASPLELRALRVLGIIADRTGDEAAAERLMTLAAGRSLRDPVAHVWLLERRVAERDWARALFHADVLMRKPMVGYDATPTMVAAAFDTQARPLLVERMKPRPRWRTTVLRQVARASPPAAFELLMDLKEAGSPPADEEAAAVVARMVADGAVMNAFVAWTQLLPGSAVEGLGDIYDAGFEGRPGAAPFNWALATRGQAGAEIGPGPNGEGRALYVRFGANKTAALAQQLLLLPPGRYELTTRTWMEQPRRGEELRWVLTCHQGPRLAELPSPDEALVWREASTPLVIPAQGCAVQRLALNAHPADIPGAQLRGWIDQVALRRLD